MIKISTLFKKDPNDLGRVINEVNPENQWALTEGEATQKWDGTAVAVIDGEEYKRYDVKKGRLVPEGAIPCQEPDAITGHWPHWILVSDGPEDAHIREAFNNMRLNGRRHKDGTFEAIGPKINGNKEGLKRHEIARHGARLVGLKERSFEYIKAYLSDPRNNIEGIVFHHPDGRMCKIRKSDFGIKRNS